MSRYSKATSYRQRKSQFARPCVVCGVPTFYSHCDQHVPVATRTDLEGRLKHERALKRLRPKILKRDNYTCQKCGTQDKTGKTLEVDHLQSFANGGSAEANNLRLLCVRCHRRKTEEDKKPSKPKNPLKGS